MARAWARAVPTDRDGAVSLAARLVFEAGQAKLTDDLVQSDRRTHRVRTTRPAVKARAGM